MPSQWSNQFRHNLKEGAGKRCSECRADPLKCSSHHAHSFAGVEGPRGLTLRATSVRSGSQDIRSFEVLCASEARSCVKEDVDVLGSTTLRTPLSGTFLQTLPDLVTPNKGALFISAQLSTDAVSALQKVRVLI